jgi:hypothetical protein
MGYSRFAFTFVCIHLRPANIDAIRIHAAVINTQAHQHAIIKIGGSECFDPLFSTRSRIMFTAIYIKQNMQRSF